MSSHARTRLRLLFWAVSAALVSLTADLAAQSAAHQPPRTLAVWIDEARASPFHDLMVSGTLANPAAGLADDEGVRVSDMVRPPMTPVPVLPDSAVSFRKVFVGGDRKVEGLHQVTRGFRFRTADHVGLDGPVEGLAES